MIFENEIFYAEFESSEVPWIKLFAKRKCREISDLEDFEREAIFRASLICEQALREFYAPEKINWASFANYVPQVHIHIQARFKDDSYYPESMWGKAQREGAKRDLRLDEFGKILASKLENEFAQG